MRFIKYNDRLNTKNYSNKSRSRYDQLETKYQDQLKENLRMTSQISRKDLDINHWKEKCESLERILNEERNSINTERLEWKAFKDDLLLVVRAADDYKSEAMKAVEKLESENFKLRERTKILEAKIKITNDTIVQRRAGENQLLLTEKQSNTLETLDVKVELPSITPIPVCRKENKIITPRNNNKENCDGIGYKINLDYEGKTQSSNSTRINTPALQSTKISETGAENLDQNQDSYDPLVTLVRVSGGSKRNALLRWCQSRTIGYKNVDITNFSTSWSDGIALCALLHSFLPDIIPFESLKPENSKENFEIAFKAAETASIPTTLSISEMVSNERPSWEKVMNYVKDIYIKLGSCD